MTFVDTNILVYAHDSSAGAKCDRARDVLKALWGSRTGCVSVQVLQELYGILTKKVHGMQPETALEIVETYSTWRVHRPSAADVLVAIALHQRHQVSFWDAMILTSAGRLRCSHVLSEDLNSGQLIQGVRVVDPLSSSI